MGFQSIPPLAVKTKPFTTRLLDGGVLVDHFGHPLEAAEKIGHGICEVDQHLMAAIGDAVMADEYRGVCRRLGRVEFMGDETPGLEGPQQIVQGLA